MPTYLLHGFRWPRPLVRIHIILQNLDDAAAEWLVAPDTTACLKDNFEELYPAIMDHLPGLRFIEQYDPEDMSPGVGSQPYAYVADIVHEIRLGLDIDDVRGKGVTNEQWGSILELRDKLAPEEKVGWFVVVCGDEERWAPSEGSLQDAANGYTQKASTPMTSPTPQQMPYSPPMQSLPYRNGVSSRPGTSDGRSIRTTSTETPRDLSSPELPQKGFKKFVGVLTRRKSRSNIRELHPSGSSYNGFNDAPPVPALPKGLTP